MLGILPGTVRLFPEELRDEDGNLLKFLTWLERVAFTVNIGIPKCASGE